MIEAVDFIFFDSGTGGLPYMLYLKKQEPLARCMYLADTRNFPYGDKSPSEIIEAAVHAFQLILKRFLPKAIVICCNTLSVGALSVLREKFPQFSFVGTVPAIKQASAVSKKRSIGLLATNRTINDPYTTDLIERFAPDCTIVKRGDPGLVDFVEHSFFSATDEQKEDVVRPSIDFFRSHDVDAIVLGCTHFLHIAELSAKLAAPDIQMIDSCAGVVNQALRLVQVVASTPPKDTQTQDQTFFITGHDANSDKEFSEARYQLIAQKLGIPYGGVCE